MTDENSIRENTNDIDGSVERGEYDESDRISLVQWILLFASLGALIYFSPMLFKLLPK